MLEMRKPFSVGLQVFVFSASWAAWGATSMTPPPPVEKLQAFPKQIFAQEGTAVLFTARASRKDAQLAIIQIDDAGKPLRYVGVLNDDQTFGDRVKNDGIFSRKMEIQGRRSTILRFAVITDSGQITKKNFSTLPAIDLRSPYVTEVEVVLRPTFVQLLHNVWDRFSNPSEKQHSEY